MQKLQFWIESEGVKWMCLKLDSWILRFLIIEHLIFRSTLTPTLTLILTLTLTLNLTLILTLLKVVRTQSYIFQESKNQESNLTFMSNECNI